MSRKIISTFTAAAMSTSIALAVPVGVTAVSSLTVVPEAQASGLKKNKRPARRKFKKTKDFATAPVNIRDHRQKLERSLVMVQDMTWSGSDGD
jgi:hypothetical protein